MRLAGALCSLLLLAPAAALARKPVISYGCFSRPRLIEFRVLRP